jgi:hypothetical protein
MDMKMFFSKWLIGFTILLFAAATASAQVPPAPSTWKNDKGSILNVWSVTGDVVLGQFINQAQGFECQGIPYPAAGRVQYNGKLFFVVTFAKCNSFTIWHGRVNGPQIKTKWTLFYVDKNGDPAKLNGADTFTIQ